MRGYDLKSLRATTWGVTGVAVTDAGGIMSPGAASEGCGGMTGGTVQAGLNVRGVRGYLTFRDITIVARNAIIGDAGMVESRRFEDASVVADTAILIGRDMSGFLRRCKPSIVTGTAVIHDAHVAEGCRLKAGGLVAVDAIAAGRYMEI